MEILYRQVFIGYCVVYMMANVFRNSAFLKYLGNERFKACGDDEYNELLAELLPKMNLKVGSVAHVNQSYPHLPADYIWALINMDDVPENCDFELKITPYFLSVRRIKEYYHATAVLKVSGIGLFYIDPVYDKIIKLKDANHLASHFIDCVSVARPYQTTDNNFIILNGDQFGWDCLLMEQSA